MRGSVPCADPYRVRIRTVRGSVPCADPYRRAYTDCSLADFHFSPAHFLTSPHSSPPPPPCLPSHPIPDPVSHTIAPHLLNFSASSVADVTMSLKSLRLRTTWEGGAGSRGWIGCWYGPNHMHHETAPPPCLTPIKALPDSVLLSPPSALPPPPYSFRPHTSLRSPNSTSVWMVLSCASSRTMML